jgi:hypothetical protein
MYFWDGTNWVESTASTPTRGARGTRWGATAVMLLAAALLIVPFGTASAAQPRTTSWIALASVDGRTAAGQPRLGSLVGFATSYPSSVRNPRVAVRCDQAGALVYADAAAVGDGFVLGGGGSDWLRNGGPANCQADLFYFTYKGSVQAYHWLASTSFEAAG